MSTNPVVAQNSRPFVELPREGTEPRIFSPPPPYYSTAIRPPYSAPMHPALFQASYANHFGPPLIPQPYIPSIYPHPLSPMTPASPSACPTCYRPFQAYPKQQMGTHEPPEPLLTSAAHNSFRFQNFRSGHSSHGQGHSPVNAQASRPVQCSAAVKSPNSTDRLVQSELPASDVEQGEPQKRPNHAKKLTLLQPSGPSKPDSVLLSSTQPTSVGSISNLRSSERTDSPDVGSIGGSSSSSDDSREGILPADSILTPPEEDTKKSSIPAGEAQVLSSVPKTIRQRKRKNMQLPPSAVGKALRMVKTPSARLGQATVQMPRDGNRAEASFMVLNMRPKGAWKRTH